MPLDLSWHTLCFAFTVPGTSLSQTCERWQANQRTDEQSGKRLQKSKGLIAGWNSMLAFITERKAFVIRIAAERQEGIWRISQYGKCSVYPWRNIWTYKRFLRRKDLPTCRPWHAHSSISMRIGIRFGSDWYHRLPLHHSRMGAL